ncbi:MAG: aminomethyl-transferring glycine dehydrogenase [Zoogloeaceae bacterium]|jgi:glycine dehydrogenase|nr:aminomethyl-transferring glycine dehydrogenase [Zoogloeaceae bacterium]
MTAASTASPAASLSAPLADLLQQDEFIARHLGPGPAEQAGMLAAIGVDSADALMAEALPEDIRLPADLDLPPPRREHQALADLKAIASKNTLRKNLIGLGYHDTLTPAVILRNVLENPGWYTAYTPYQAEIAQGRLESLLTFQQMTIDLTGLELANASLLDEATAAAEAMTMARRVSKTASNRFFVDRDVFPQTLDVLKTRADGLGFELVVDQPDAIREQEFFGALLQYPNQFGEIGDTRAHIAALKAAGAITAVATDLMALALLESPGALGADIALGSSQRFGVPPGFGGPHAAFFAARVVYARAMPGRIIGVSRDAHGKPARRMALQTREQHIRREKANSNLCTAQALLASMAGMYAVYHGPDRLRAIAARIHRLAAILDAGLRQAGIVQCNRHYFDTLLLDLGERAEIVWRTARTAGYNLRLLESEPDGAAGRIGIAVNEKTTPGDIAALFGIIAGKTLDLAALDAALAGDDPSLPESLLRRDAILAHPVFNRHHTEHAMLRYLKRLQNRDLAMDHAMISLGSCTMKLNAASEMIPITWPEFADLHPFAPPEQASGTLEMIGQLADWLGTIAGFDAVSLQPNSGAQGEYAGLLAIRRYHASRNEDDRRVCLIPESAHGTNPASARMAGLTVVEIACDARGNVDLADLEARAGEHASRLACLMLTYPSTHGVFEEAVREICAIVHARGGQVYMDGANLNAQVGWTSPGFIGADVSHMNLHKTFAIPHGGGGPGMGPIALKAHLAPFMPGHVFSRAAGGQSASRGRGAVAAAPFGSASILPISWMYIAMLGGKGLKLATRTAILNANYIASRLGAHYPVLHTGRHGRVAHECILDIRPVKAASGVSEIDIAKRLMDYGFHAPTVSFPVPGAIMVEPTESESKAELDRFIDAFIAIREEIRRVETGAWPKDDNPLKHAPHTQEALSATGWTHPYTRAEAAFPLPWVAENKFWPSVGRIDDVYGDRNLSGASCGLQLLY